MDVALVIKQRLGELGLDQKDLAAASQVTESYISQLLSRKKAPPAPARTDIYEKIGRFLTLPAGELAKLAKVQRKADLKKKVAGPPRPLFRECRDLLLRKCAPATRKELVPLFEKAPFGELERLVTQTFLDVAQNLAREELRNERWLRNLAKMSGRTYVQMRVAILELLDADVFSVSIENCTVFLDPMIETWDIDLKSFSMEFVLNSRLTPRKLKRIEFLEVEPRESLPLEPGLEQFLNDKLLSADASEEEIEFLRNLRFKDRRPAPLYYYRELQNLRDPLHFLPPPGAKS